MLSDFPGHCGIEALPLLATGGYKRPPSRQSTPWVPHWLHTLGSLPGWVQEILAGQIYCVWVVGWMGSGMVAGTLGVGLLSVLVGVVHFVPGVV